jgi:hypothetical protein
MSISVLYSDIALIIYESIVICIIIVLLVKLYRDRKKSREEYENYVAMLQDRDLKKQITNEKRR